MQHVSYAHRKEICLLHKTTLHDRRETIRLENFFFIFFISLIKTCLTRASDRRCRVGFAGPPPGGISVQICRTSRKKDEGMDGKAAHCLTTKRAAELRIPCEVMCKEHDKTGTTMYRQVQSRATYCSLYQGYQIIPGIHYSICGRKNNIKVIAVVCHRPQLLCLT